MDLANLTAESEEYDKDLEFSDESSVDNTPAMPKRHSDGQGSGSENIVGQKEYMYDNKPMATVKQQNSSEKKALAASETRKAASPSKRVKLEEDFNKVSLSDNKTDSPKPANGKKPPTAANAANSNFLVKEEIKKEVKEEFTSKRSPKKGVTGEIYTGKNKSNKENEWYDKLGFNNNNNYSNSNNNNNDQGTTPPIPTNQ